MNKKTLQKAKIIYKLYNITSASIQIHNFYFSNLRIKYLKYGDFILVMTKMKIDRYSAILHIWQSGDHDDTFDNLTIYSAILHIWQSNHLFGNSTHSTIWRSSWYLVLITTYVCRLSNTSFANVVCQILVLLTTRAQTTVVMFCE